ncbi:MAG: molecular chaperone TorD family protein [Candidatus Thiodiazotropha sp.]|nr:molecular chaperone TorD family protein [Candidatus Thiodiazotropha sp.]MCM8884021.1 molecular chaperone TorD family protein [Candidatus Thiodiazotropha sp.]MCM8919682.1 molecular chaperone TorD family protein [Candidatus Thiodiazotropha sp.]
MIDLSQAVQTDDPSTGTRLPEAEDLILDEEQHYRIGAYGLLAQLLRHMPDQPMLDQVAGFAGIEPSRDELALAMSMLGLSASDSRPESVDSEFHDLFIGMGRGELVPYGSWYLTGFLMEKPLGRLRDDLAELGFQRQEGITEPEDHVAALCEVMAMLINDGISFQQQSQFFETHMAGWLERFFADLSEAKSAVFYRAVGRFGTAFVAMEKRYLSMTV